MYKYINHESLALPSSNSYLQLLSFCGDTKPPMLKNKPMRLGNGRRSQGNNSIHFKISGQNWGQFSGHYFEPAVELFEKFIHMTFSI